MNTNIKSICEIVEYIKEKLADYQYKPIMDYLMVLNNEKEEEEKEEEADEETIEERHRQIMFLNGYIPTIPDENSNLVFTRRFYMSQCYSTEIS